VTDLFTRHLTRKIGPSRAGETAEERCSGSFGLLLIVHVGRVDAGARTDCVRCGKRWRLLVHVHVPPARDDDAELDATRHSRQPLAKRVLAVRNGAHERGVISERLTKTDRKRSVSMRQRRGTDGIVRSETFHRYVD
jgi:hypothetical protein